MHQGHMCKEERSCVNTVRREPPENLGGESSRETNPASNLILNFQPLELGENNFLFLLFKPSNFQ